MNKIKHLPIYFVIDGNIIIIIVLSFYYYRYMDCLSYWYCALSKLTKRAVDWIEIYSNASCVENCFHKIKSISFSPSLHLTFFSCFSLFFCGIDTRSGKLKWEQKKDKSRLFELKYTLYRVKDIRCIFMDVELFNKDILRLEMTMRMYFKFWISMVYFEIMGEYFF